MRSDLLRVSHKTSQTCCQAALWPNLQRVADACVAQHGSQHPVVLPFDLCASHTVMEAQAKTADEAFGSAGVDYMVHVAGEAALPVRGSLLWGWAATLPWLAGAACMLPRGGGGGGGGAACSTCV